MHTIVITGASGFIGKHLVAKLLQLTGLRIKLLTRNKHQDLNNLTELGVDVVEGNLLDPNSIQGLLEQGCTVINLAYLWHEGERGNITATTNLLTACKSANVKRLIHCSTAGVVGRVPDNTITETTPCHPITEYGITKLKIENAIIATAKNHFDVVILRPTAVFGEDGANLKKLANDLSIKYWLPNYLKSCIFGKRRMNLLHVTNMVAAITFFIDLNESMDGEVFIVSDDDNPKNNFDDVERFLLKALDIPYYKLPRLPVPLAFLKFLLNCIGKNNINPYCNYSPKKLLDIGFKRAISFENGLADYAKWYRSSYIDKQESVTN